MLNNFNPNAVDANDPNGAGSNNNSNNGSNGGPAHPASGPYPWSNTPLDDDFDPEDYLINYNKKYQNEKPTLFRDELIQQTLSCLIGLTKPNA